MTTSQVTTVVTPATAIAPAGPYDLIDLATLKDDLSVTTTADDAFLSRTITRCSGAISQFCNRVFAIETVQDTWISTCSGFQRGAAGPLALSRFPVIGISVLTEYTAGLLAGVDYTLDPKTGLLYRINAAGDEMTWLPAQTSVTYQAGFTAVPADIQDAVSRLVKARYLARARDPLVRSESVPGVGSFSYAVGSGTDGGNMPEEIADALVGYRVPSIA